MTNNYEENETLDKSQTEMIDTVSESVTAKKEKFSLDPILEEVNIPLTVEFGHTYLTIEELLRLEKNGIVELVEYVEEPLTIYANDVLIGYGEIVEADGRFAVRFLSYNEEVL